MEKRKVKFIATFIREYEIDLNDYQDVVGMEPCKTIEEAAKFDAEGIEQDPFGFIDNSDTKVEVKFEIFGSITDEEIDAFGKFTKAEKKIIKKAYSEHPRGFFSNPRCALY